MPWATVFDNVWLPLRLQGRGRRRGRATRSMAALGHRRPRAVRRGLPARALGRDEDAGLDRPGAGHAAAAAADGRAVRGARRDHPLPAQRRPAAPLAEPELDRGLRHPQRLRVGLPLAAASWSWRPGRAAWSPTSRSPPPTRATRRSAPREPYNAYCRAGLGRAASRDGGLAVAASPRTRSARPLDDRAGTAAGARPPRPHRGPAA